MTNEKWWEEMITDEAKQKSDILELVEPIVSEAERRGYERAMEEVRSALKPGVMSWFDYEAGVNRLYRLIPKSFFEK